MARLPSVFRSQISFISTGTLTSCDLCRNKFHAGEDEGSADQSTRDRTKRVECLGKIEALFRSVGIAKLGDKRVRSGLQKRQTAGNHKKRTKKVSVLPNQGSGPEQKCPNGVQQQTNNESGFVSNLLITNAAGMARRKYPM